MENNFEKLTYITNKPITHDSINRTSSINTPYHLIHSNSLNTLSLAQLKAMLDYLDSSDFKLTHENVEQTREKILLIKQEIENRINLIFGE